MKVSILSMQRIINYGSFLQAYALKSVLERMGHEVSFIDILPGECHEAPMVDDKQNPINKILGILQKGHILKMIRFRRAGRTLEGLIKNNQKEILGFGEEKQLLSKDCEAVIIGSDEVFNCAPTCSWGVSTQLFGNIDVPLVVSYAASCGYTVYDDVPVQCRDGINKALHHLQAVSVRDQNTFDFVNKISGLIPEYHLDPVLIYDFEDEVARAEKELGIDGKYMIVYAYYGRIAKKEEIDAIISYARKHDLKLYCVGAEQLWCDKFPVWTPFQVLAAFKHAQCIVTDTFHGTVISAKYNKKFAVLVRESNANKLNDLITRLNLETHRVTDIRDFDKIIDYEMDYSFFNKEAEKQRIRTLNYFSEWLRNNR